MTDGGVAVELGCGHGSTPLMHAICAAQGRRLISYDDGSHWLGEMAFLAGPDHEFRQVHAKDAGDDGKQGLGDWGALDLDKEAPEASLVFLDHGSIKGRGVSLQKLARLPHHPLVLVHDAGAGGVELYELAPGLALFLFKYAYTTYWPHTVICSHAPLDWAAALTGGPHRYHNQQWVKV
jgi:hypothetical protein